MKKTASKKKPVKAKNTHLSPKRKEQPFVFNGIKYKSRKEAAEIYLKDLQKLNKIFIASAKKYIKNWM